MNAKIQCLMSKGGSLDEGVRTALYFAACELLRNGKKKGTFQDEDGTGFVSTEHRRCVVGSWMSGIRFHAEVESHGNFVECDFVVNDIDMPSEEEMILEGRWIG